MSNLREHHGGEYPEKYMDMPLGKFLSWLESKSPSDYESLERVLDRVLNNPSLKEAHEELEDEGGYHLATTFTSPYHIEDDIIQNYGLKNAAALKELLDDIAYFEDDASIDTIKARLADIHKWEGTDIRDVFKYIEKYHPEWLRTREDGTVELKLDFSSESGEPVRLESKRREYLRRLAEGKISPENLI